MTEPREKFPQENDYSAVYPQRQWYPQGSPPEYQDQRNLQGEPASTQTFVVDKYNELIL